MTLQEAIIKGTAYNDQAAIDRLDKEISELEAEIKHKKQRRECLANRALVGQLYVRMIEESV